MTTTDTSTGEVFVIGTERVREAIGVLLDRETHQHFIAYLYLRRLAAHQGRIDHLSPKWSDLGNWLRVEGGPPRKPHLRPFWKGRRNARQEWLAENLAGSFSPASLREELQRVVETDAAGMYSLRPGHAALAFEHLLLGTRMEALALAAFLYRDYGFTGLGPPTPADLITVFRQDFGYDEHDGEFDTLYATTWTGGEPWFEVFDEEAMS